MNDGFRSCFSDTYPATPPIISVKSASLSADQVTSLTTALSDTCSSTPDQPVLKALVSSFDSWVLDNNIDTTAESQSRESKLGSNKHKGKKKPKKEKSKAEETPQIEKKPPMKTASDVIKRLQWDEAVDRECFIVGYMDRLVGLVERAFVDFTWEDLASVDHFALAIPQHRIQYFKYKEEKVWDKNERLDNVFGSTGSNVTIVETVEKYEAKLRQAVEAENAATDVTNEPDATTGYDKAEETNKNVTDTETAIQDADLSKENTKSSPSQEASVGD